MKTLVILGLCLVLEGSASALVVAGYGAATKDMYDRFTSGYSTAPVPNTSATFIGSTFDLSGVGWRTDQPDYSVAMISDQYFVRATHNPVGPTISFLSPVLYSANPGNPSAAVVSYAVDTSFAFAPKSGVLGLQGDLTIGRLLGSTSLDQVSGTAARGINHYPVLLLHSFNEYLNLPMLIYGHGGFMDYTASPRLGTNALDGFTAADLNGDTVNESFTDYFSYSGTPPGEAMIEGHDSGAPSFANWYGSLALVGVHSATASDQSGTQYSLDMFIPDYLGSMSANAIPFETVPEPSKIVLMIVSVLGILGHRRRNH